MQFLFAIMIRMETNYVFYHIVLKVSIYQRWKYIKTAFCMEDIVLDERLLCIGTAFFFLNILIY